MARPPLTSAGRLLLAGSGLSTFGTWIDFIAILTLAAYRHQVSSMQMAGVSAAMLLPAILLGPALGRRCDRGHAKRWLIGSIALRVACTVGVLLFHDYAVFLLLVASRAAFSSAAVPAVMVLAVRSVPKDQLPRFHSILNILGSAAKIVAPALGTISSSLSSEALTLVASAVCSLASLLLLARVPTSEPAGAADSRGHATAPPSPGATVGRMLPLLWIAGANAFFVFMVNNLVPVVLARAGFDKSVLGILISCSGAGNILSGVWLARRSAAVGARGLQGRPSEMIVPALAQAAGFGLIGLVLAILGPRGPERAVALSWVFFGVGVASARFAIALNVHLTTHHRDRIGAASSLLQSTQSAMILVAPIVGAAVLDAAGPAALFAAAAASAIVLYGLFFAAPMLSPRSLQRSTAG